MTNINNLGLTRNNMIKIVTLITTIKDAYMARISSICRPETALLFITERCNANCQFCSVGKLNDPGLKEQELSFEEIDRVLSELKELGCNRINLVDGEPLLRKDVVDIIKCAKQKDFTVGISTNGFLIDEDLAVSLKDSGIDHIHVSLDSPDDLHDELRGVKGAFSKVDRALDLLKAEDGRKFYLGTNTVITAQNLSKLEAIAEYAAQKGLNGFSLQPFLKAQVRNTTSLTFFEIRPEQVGQLREKIEGIIIKYGHLLRNSPFFLKHIMTYFKDSHTEKFPCLAGYLMINVFANGEVSPCYFLPRTGNLRQKSLKKVLHSGEYLHLLKRVSEKDCPGCWCPNIHEYNILFRPAEALFSIRSLWGRI